MWWLGRIFHERDVVARLVLLDLSGLGYLLFHPSGHQADATQWSMAVAAFVGVLALHRLPLVSMLAQTALFGLAAVLLDDPTIHQVGAGWTLLELIIGVRRTAVIWWAAALLAVVYVGNGVAHGAIDLSAEPGRAAFGTATLVGLPVLLGLLVRSSRDLARQAEERAAEQRRHREAETRMAVIRERAAIARELHDVVALTTFGDDDHLYPALTAGACGFLLKDAPPAELLDGIRRAATGDSPFSPQVLQRIVRRAVHAQTATPAPPPGLTDRERDVLELVAEGLSNTEIAERLHIGVTTVKTHINSLMAKTGAPNRVRLALRWTNG